MTIRIIRCQQITAAIFRIDPKIPIVQHKGERGGVDGWPGTALHTANNCAEFLRAEPGVHFLADNHRRNKKRPIS